MTKYDMIREEILDIIDHSQPGDKLPSLTDLERKFDASRGTARKVYQQLVSDGTIVTVHGVGHFIPKLSNTTVAEARERLAALDLDEPMSAEDAYDLLPEQDKALLAIHREVSEAIQAISHAWDLVADLHDDHDIGHDYELLNLRYAIEAADMHAHEILEFTLAA